ncbi:GIY-YIG nuclease family protein, partial [Proteus mirabilis]
MKLTKEIINNDLAAAGRPVRMIGDYEHIHKRTIFRCDIGHEFLAVPGEVRRRTNCPHCRRLTKEIINERLAAQGLDIRLIGKFVRSDFKAEFSCPCGCRWFAAPATVLRKSGCPNCATSGILLKDNAYIYVMSYGDNLTKIGSSIHPRERARKLSRRYGRTVELIAAYSFGDGYGLTTYREEQKAHKHFAAYRSMMRGFEGATELFKIS